MLEVSWLRHACYALSLTGSLLPAWNALENGRQLHFQPQFPPELWTTVLRQFFLKPCAKSYRAIYEVGRRFAFTNCELGLDLFSTSGFWRVQCVGRHGERELFEGANRFWIRSFYFLELLPPKTWTTWTPQKKKDIGGTWPADKTTETEKRRKSFRILSEVLKSQFTCIYIYIHVLCMTLIIDPIVPQWWDFINQGAQIWDWRWLLETRLAVMMGWLHGNTCMLQELLFERSRRKICISPSRKNQAIFGY